MNDPDFLKNTIKDIIQFKVSPAHRHLTEFLNSNPEYRTDKNNPNTNIIDQKNNKTYNIPNDKLDDFFLYLERCRLEHLNISFAERQQEYSGIMFDFDIYQKCMERKTTARCYHKIIMQISDILTKTIKFETTSISYHVFIIHKPAIATIDETTYKDGFHLLIPEIQITRPHKRYIIDQIIKSDTLINSFKEVPLVKEANSILDGNSAHVPVMFFGNNNNNKPTYILTHFYKITIEPNESPIIDILSVESLINNTIFNDKFSSACVLNDSNILNNDTDASSKCFIQSCVKKNIKTKVTDRCPHVVNFTHELSLNFSPNKKHKWLNKQPYHAIETIIPKITQLTETATIPSDLLFETETNVSTLAVHDADSLILRDILSILPQSYAIEYEKWFKVICAIANINLQYKPIADWFSQRAGEKYNKQSFDHLWHDIEHSILHRKNIDKPTLSKGSIILWAKEANRALYDSVMARSYQQILLKLAYQNDGEIEHANAALILHNMIGYKFIVDEDLSNRNTKTWYEFVLPKQNMVTGEVYKWRKEIGTPTVIHTFITKTLTQIYRNVENSIKHTFESCEDENKSKYYKLVLTNFRKSTKSLNNNSFQNGILKQAQYLFEKRGFSESLDKIPGVIGVGNGILTFENGKARLIKGYHDYRISKFTPVNYIPYDPNNPYVIQIEKITHEIYPEDDFYHWIWLYFSTLLTGRPKDVFFFAWGPGSCGKSTIAEFIKSTIGFKYARKVPINLFTDSKEKAEGANSALMSINGLLFAYSSESKQGQLLNSSRVKELISAEAQSGREMYGTQSEFYNNATLYIGTNNIMYFDNPYDDAMWRRFRAYHHKTRFLDHPDPNNKFEKQKVEDYMFKFTTQPEYQEAVLSILVHYKEILDTQYDGKLSNVISPTLDNDTAKYRNTQDTINHFIIDQMTQIKPNDNTDNTDNTKHELSIMTIARAYKSWFLSMYTTRQAEVNDMSVIIHRLIESRLKNSIIMKSANHHDTIVIDWSIKAKPNTIQPEYSYLN